MTGKSLFYFVEAKFFYTPIEGDCKVNCVSKNKLLILVTQFFYEESRI